MSRQLVLFDYFSVPEIKAAFPFEKIFLKILIFVSMRILLGERHIKKMSALSNSESSKARIISWVSCGSKPSWTFTMMLERFPSSSSYFPKYHSLIHCTHSGVTSLNHDHQSYLEQGCIYPRMFQSLHFYFFATCKNLPLGSDSLLSWAEQLSREFMFVKKQKLVTGWRLI